MHPKIIRLMCSLVAGLALLALVITLFNPTSAPVEAPSSPVELAVIHGWIDPGSLTQADDQPIPVIGLSLWGGVLLLAGGWAWYKANRATPRTQPSTSSRQRLGGLFITGSLALLTGLAVVLFGPSQPVVAVPGNQDDIPNGNTTSFPLDNDNRNCYFCHGSAPDFDALPGSILSGRLSSALSGGLADQPWHNKAATAPFVDSDSDGFTNGEELQDPTGVAINNAPFGDTLYVSNPSTSTTYSVNAVTVRGVPLAPQITNIVGVANGQTLSGDLTISAALRYAGLSKVVYSFKNSIGTEVYSHTVNSTPVTTYSNKYCLANGNSSTAGATCPTWNSLALPNGVYSLTVTAFDKRAAGLGGPQTGSLLRTNLTISNALVGSPVTVFSDDNTVNGNCTLREAIIAANTDTPVDLCPAGNPSGVDTLVLNAGTYQLSLAGDGEDTAQTGDLDITDSLTIIGQGENLTIIDGGSLDRVFDIPDQPNDPTVNFSNLSIRNGRDTNQSGGGIFVPFLADSVVRLTEVTVFSNTGYGIHNGGIMTLDRVNILSNTEIGLYSTGDGPAPVTVLNSLISGNNGGIFIVNDGQVTLDNSVIGSNTTTGDGGGITSFNLLTMTNSAIIGNQAGNNGGGLYQAGGTANLINVTISGNRAAGDGGGLYHNSLGGVTNLNNVTIVNNIADNDGNNTGNGGGIFLDNVGGDVINFRNSIIAGNNDNSPGTKHPDCSGTLTSQSHNLIQTSTGCTIAGNLTGNVIGQNPNLGPLTGSPAYHPLLSVSSPAYDAGNPAAPGSDGNSCAVTDQRGVSRPQGNACDIGAIEFRAPSLLLSKTAPTTATAGSLITYTLTVTNLGDVAVSNWVITDPVPAGATFVQALNGGLLLAGNQVRWSAASLAARSTAQVSFVVRASQTITNSNYQASAAGIPVVSGNPVVTTISGGGNGGVGSIYLPVVLK